MDLQLVQIFIWIFCIILSECANSLRNSFFLLARQDLSLAELNTSTDPLIVPCRKLGVWPHPSSCSEYIVCRQESRPKGINIIMEHYKCSFGIYDILTGRCNWAKLSAPCKEGNVSFTLTEPEPTFLSFIRPITQDPNTVTTKDDLSKQRPSSYVSELTGLSCKTSGYFPHPINNTKFYRCVALHPNNFMIYLFSCETGLLYEPTVRACVKSLGEERMETGVDFTVNAQTPIRVVELCGAMQYNPSGKSSGLFRNPLNCRRFFRCTSTSVSLKIEQFSCPTGLFFDEERRSCTWASETAECVSNQEDVDGKQAVTHSTTGTRITQASAKLATIWVTMPKKVTRMPIPPLPVSLATSTISVPHSSQNFPALPKSVPRLANNQTTDRLSLADVVIGPNFDANWLYKQALKPPPYLTATGILVSDKDEFHCVLSGTFPSSNPCVFYKCEKYTWVRSFLLFRFTCPPHTVFANGTCEYNATINCPDSQDNHQDTGISAVSYVTEPTNVWRELQSTASSLRDKLEQQKPSRAMLCTRDGTFPLPFASPCDTRFMVCRRLTGPLHFFVSVHECPPSLTFSPPLNQCVDPVTENIQCTGGNYDLSVSINSSENQEDINEDSVTPMPVTNQTIPSCSASGFFKLSCRRFRRCEPVLMKDSARSQTTIWMSYDFECGKGLIFDESVTACVHPTDSTTCENSPIANDQIPTPSALTMGHSGESVLVGTRTTVNVMEENEEEATDVLLNLTMPVSSPPIWTLPPFWLRLGNDSATSTVTFQETSISTEISDESTTDNTSPILMITEPETESIASDASTVQPDDVSEDAGTFKSTTTMLPSIATASQLKSSLVTKKSKSPVCYRSGYFLYQDDTTCQRFYRCLQLTPEPNSFVMLHYRCDDGFVFDLRYFACTTIDNAPSCEQVIAQTANFFATPDPELNRDLVNSDNDQQTDLTTISSMPVKILPQVWQMSANDSTNGAGSLICTTQRIYRLQTCGYYYSCIETETKGRFRLEEIYCETLYLEIATGQCVSPPPNDPCNAQSMTKFSSTWAVRKPSTKMRIQDDTTSTQSSSTIPPITTTDTTFNSTTPLPSTPRMSSSALNSLNRTRHQVTQIPAAIKISGSSSSSGSGNDDAKVTSLDLSTSVFISPVGNPEYFSLPKNRVTSGTYSPVARPVVQSTFHQPKKPTTSPFLTQFQPVGINGLLANNAAMAEKNNAQTLSAYRDSFNELYAQLNANSDEGRQTTTTTTTTGIPLVTSQPSLILNFNTVSGQLSEAVKTGVRFHCRAEGYFRKPRDVTCSKFYLCVKIAPHQYNLFEFMCLPRNGIQWKYNQKLNSCVDPEDVEDC